MQLPVVHVAQGLLVHPLVRVAIPGGIAKDQGIREGTVNNAQAHRDRQIHIGGEGTVPPDAGRSRGIVIRVDDDAADDAQRIGQRSADGTEEAPDIACCEGDRIYTEHALRHRHIQRRNRPLAVLCLKAKVQLHRDIDGRTRGENHVGGRDIDLAVELPADLAEVQTDTSH